MVDGVQIRDKYNSRRARSLGCEVGIELLPVNIFSHKILIKCIFFDFTRDENYANARMPTL